MKKTILYPAIYLTSMLFSSCGLVFEEDISEEEVELYTPADSLTTNTASQTFWWSEVDEATKYHLQIASPNFENPDYLDLDTVVTNNSFTFTIRYNGTFTWRVKASNGAYNTPYSYGIFFINFDLDLTDQILNVLKPEDEALYNTQNISFIWDELPAASEYVFIVKKNDWAGENVYDPLYTTENALSLPLDTVDLEEGTYVWSVQAINSLPSFSDEYKGKLILDWTPPLAPELTELDTIDQTDVNISWTHKVQKPEISLYDSIYVYKAENKKSLVVKTKVEDAETYTIKDLVDGTRYYWYVKTIDRAGNASEESSSEFFIKN